MSLFDTGIRPAIDEYLAKKAAEERDYGDYWSASSAGYCMRKLIFERLKVPHVKEQDARKTRVFEAGHIFHDFIQGITKEAGLSIAQEVELQDEDLMVRGHFDDLVLIDTTETLVGYNSTKEDEDGFEMSPSGHKLEISKKQLILYDYKTQNSRAFTYQKGKPMSFYHMMQLGTYMYMLRKGIWPKTTITEAGAMVKDLSEARILKISKDDLRMEESQLLWSPQLEKAVYEYWSTLNGYWKSQTIPKCTCADREGGFLAREQYNDYFFDGEPCSLKWYQQCKEKGLVK